MFILVNGFAVFFKFNAADFLTSYINIPIFAGLYVFWKIARRTKIWRPSEMDFVTVGGRTSTFMCGMEALCSRL